MSLLRSLLTFRFVTVFLVCAALAVHNTIGSSVLLGGLLGDSEAIDAEIVAYAGDDKMCPFSVYNGGEDKVCTEIPQLEAGGYRPKAGTRDGKVGVVDDERPSNHGRKHDGPVRERLVGEMCQDDLRGHTAEHQRHGQAVKDKVVILEELGVWRPEPSHGAYDEDDKGGPFLEQG